MSYLALAKRIGQRLGRRDDRNSPESASTILERSIVADVRDCPGAVLLRSARFGEVWLVIAASIAEELIVEEQARPDPRPILFSEDVARLTGKSDAVIGAALEVARVFPGSRFLQ